jgi:glycosyltransferase involved in cell wall biosynthesis
MKYLVTMKKKSILIIASSSKSLINFRGKLIDCFLEKYISVHVAAPKFDHDYSTKTALIEKGVFVHSICMNNTGINPLSDIKTFWKIFILIKKIKPYYVLGYTIKPLIYGCISAYLNKAPKRIALITGLGFSFIDKPNANSPMLLSYIINLLYKIALACCNVVLFQNQDDQKLFYTLKILSKKAKSTVVNGSGVDLEKFQKAPIPNKISFLLVARILGNKGIREYIEAARQIKKTYSNTIFTLVGPHESQKDGISISEIKSWVESDTIEYLGGVDDVRPAICACSIFVLPSYREGVPRSVLEAMAMNRPIITTDVPGCRETVIHGKNGLLVKPYSSESLAKAMEHFILNPKNIPIMGEHSRKIVEDKYDVHKVNKAILKELNI